MMMANKPLLFKPEYAKPLLSIAKGDLQTAKALIDSSNPGRLENILYMIQQCVEKCLKAVLIYKQIEFPLIHDLGVLIALIPSPEHPPGGFNWTSLNPYASIRRYEEGAMAIELTEIKYAYDAAVLVVSWADTQTSVSDS